MCLVLGETLWSHSSNLGGNASVLRPLLQVPDVDGDGAPDLLILAQEGHEVISIVLKYPRLTYLIAPPFLPLPLLPREKLCDHPVGGSPRALYPEVHTYSILGSTHAAFWGPHMQHPGRLHLYRNLLASP